MRDLLANLGLQTFVVTMLQKIQVVVPYVQAIAFVAKPTGTVWQPHLMSRAT